MLTDVEWIVCRCTLFPILSKVFIRCCDKIEGIVVLDCEVVESIDFICIRLFDGRKVGSYYEDGEACRNGGNDNEPRLAVEVDDEEEENEQGSDFSGQYCC